MREPDNKAIQSIAKPDLYFLNEILQVVIVKVGRVRTD